MSKKARHTWLVLVVLLFVFALLLLLLLCRGWGFFGGNEHNTNGTTIAESTTANPTGQDADDGSQPTISVSFDAVELDKEETYPDTAGAAEGSSDTDQMTIPPSTGPNATTPSTVPTEQTKPPVVDSQPDELDYEKYMAMSAREQQQFFDDNFKDDPIAFAQWFQKIKQEYEKENPPIIVTGPINMEDYLN